MSLTPGSSRCVLNFKDKIPSGTKMSASSEDIAKVDSMRCFSLRLSEDLRGAEVLRLLSGFLNMVADKILQR